MRYLLLFRSSLRAASLLVSLSLSPSLLAICQPHDLSAKRLRKHGSVNILATLHTSLSAGLQPGTVDSGQVSSATASRHTTTLGIEDSQKRGHSVHPTLDVPPTSASARTCQPTQIEPPEPKRVAFRRIGRGGEECAQKTSICSQS